ncbi:MAG: hypothetical protein NVS1B4_03730 [Gemmatimonadaceae bacterium]
MQHGAAEYTDASRPDNSPDHSRHPAEPLPCRVKIISRYVLREHVGPLLFALTTLTSLLLLNYVARQFGDLVGKGLPWTVIGEFFLLSVPFTVAMTAPMAVLVAVLYAFSRLAAENEINALKASGVSLRVLMVPVLWGATGIAILMLVFNDQVLPRANHRLRVLQGDIFRKKPTFALKQQVINEVSPGKFYLRAGHLSETSNRMREIVIYNLGDGTHRQTIYADSGLLEMSPDQRDLLLHLYNGFMQELPRNDAAQLQRLYYKVDRVRVRGVGNTFQRDNADNYRGNREKSVCEMHDGYQAAALSFALARVELEEALVNAVHLVATGEKRTGAAAPRPTPGVWISGAYCAALGALSPKPAGAQIPQSSIARQPVVTRPRASKRSSIATPIVPPRAPALSPPDPLIGIAGQIESSRARLEDHRRAMLDYDVEIQKKFALAVACVVFVLLGAPIALRFPRGGVGLVIGVSLFVFALYYVALIAGQALADRGLVPPVAAMWAANVVFTAVGVMLLARMGREGSTSRGGDMGELWQGLEIRAATLLRRLGVPIERRRPSV